MPATWHHVALSLRERDACSYQWSDSVPLNASLSRSERAYVTVRTTLRQTPLAMRAGPMTMDRLVHQPPPIHAIPSLAIARIDARRENLELALAELRRKLSPQGNIVSEVGKRRTIEVFGEPLTPQQVVERIVSDVVLAV